jgi:ubiquitin-activating enzyme E1
VLSSLIPPPPPSCVCTNTQHPTAKNVILAGVKAVTLHDTKAATLKDLGTHFYLSEGDVGTNRAAACRSRLAELNPAVAVTAVPDGTPLSPALVAGHDVIVLTDASTADAVALDGAARSAGAAFIRADARGVFGAVFCDFGPAFVVSDTDGEQPATGIIAGITPVPDRGVTLVTCVEDERLEFQDGQLVSFSDLTGCEELAAAGPVRVSACKPTSFEAAIDSSGFSPYVRGGAVTQVKEAKTLTFRPLADALGDPGEFLISDFAKLDRPPVLHLGFQALDAFAVETGRLPGPWDAGDAARLAEIAAGLNEAAPPAARVEGLTAPDSPAAKLIAAMAHTAAGELAPMTAALGGIVGQEVVKAASGKFHPVHQFFYFDATEALPDSPPADAAITGASRYDGQVAVFGSAFQARLASTRVFLVGAGALGCEFLKNFALMGVACGEGSDGSSKSGNLTVTDDDTIERSNLSRQFLFRDADIGKAKASAAAAAAKAINPSLTVTALQNRVSPETEGVFDDGFWTSTDVVVNALDNVAARLYVDSRCVYFNKPLLESGTLGPKCNTQAVIPGLTENYGASRDPPEKSAPMCTLHSFPHNIDHCLTWARSEFEGALDVGPAEAASYLADRAGWAAGVRGAADGSAREQAGRVAAALGSDAVSDWPGAVSWARRTFQASFHDRIAQLTHTFPEDATTSSGALFWSPPKRFPRPVVFDPADPAHASLIQAAAILKARVYGVAVPDWAADPSPAGARAVADAAAAVPVPAFVPKEGVKIETDPKAEGGGNGGGGGAADGGGEDLEAILARLEAAAAALPPTFALHPTPFEKDDDTNFHMALVAGLANMRARCYSIPEVDRLTAKLIAGKIVPAIATATALATGLVGLEFYKALSSPAKPVEAYRNTFANLALPLFAAAEPVPPKTVKHGDGLAWTLWDRWTIGGDPTLQEVLDWFASKKLEAYSLSCGPSLLYNSLFPRHKDRLGRKMRDLAADVAKLDLSSPAALKRRKFDVVVACEDEDGEDLDVPLVTIEF